MVDQSKVDETGCYNTSHHSNHISIHVHVHKMACVYITVTIATTFVHVHEVSACVLMIHITMVTTSHKYNYIMASCLHNSYYSNHICKCKCMCINDTYHCGDHIT